MDLNNLELIKQSFAVIYQHKAEIASRFYEELFLAVPEARDMFQSDMFRQREMLATLLATMAKASFDPESMTKIIQRMAHSHSGLGISTEQFKAGELALSKALEDAVGDALSPEALKAWKAAIWRVTDAMIHQPTG